MKTSVFIPARFASTRFPGKLLEPLGDTCVLGQTVRRAIEAVGTGRVVVATDDPRLAEAASAEGVHVVMTDPSIPSGTERCLSALMLMPERVRPDAIVNLQADNPLISPLLIRDMADGITEDDEILTAAFRFDPSAGFEALFDPGEVKVVISGSRHALYFSRSIIPYVRDVEWREWTASARFHIHCGIYAYTSAMLHRICNLPVSPLEAAERLEQLRWLDNDIAIRVISASGATVGIDVPADLERARCLLASMQP